MIPRGSSGLLGLTPSMRRPFLQSERGLGLQRLFLPHLLALPEPLLRRAASAPRSAEGRTARRSEAAEHKVDGFTLDPQIAFLLMLAKRNQLPPLETLEPNQARAQAALYHRLLDAAPRPMARIDDAAAAGPAGFIPLRVYVPRRSGARVPGIVWYHGGGWVIGGIESHEAQLRLLADETRCAVIAVDYRLAPEHRFPAAADDALAAFRWTTERAHRYGIDPERLALGGDSAGGNLAAVVARMLRDTALPQPLVQALVYPVTDLRQTTASYRTFSDGYFLTASTMAWFVRHYLGDRKLELDPRASPLLEPDLRGLPKSYVFTAGFDPLRDEAHAYADALDAAGVPVRYVCYESLIHGFMAMTRGVRAARRAVSEIAACLRQELGVGDG